MEYEAKKKGESDVEALNNAFTYPPISDRYLEMVAKPAYTFWSRQHSSFSGGCAHTNFSVLSRFPVH